LAGRKGFECGDETAPTTQLRSASGDVSHSVVSLEGGLTMAKKKAAKKAAKKGGKKAKKK
jgi:hypothetical protein